MQFNITIPHGKGRLNASNRKDAIDQAWSIYKNRMEKMFADGSIYAIPRLCKEYIPRKMMVEMGVDQPIKPSRHLDGRPKNWLMESDYTIAMSNSKESK